MIGTALMAIGIAGGLMFYDKHLENKEKKNLIITKKENEKTPLELDIQEKYSSVYKDFSTVKETMANYNIHPMLSKIDEQFLCNGHIPKNEKEQENVLPFYDLLLCQRQNWKALKQVNLEYLNMQIPNEAMDLINERIKDLHTEFVELQVSLENSRLEKAKNILNNINDIDNINTESKIGLVESKVSDITSNIENLISLNKSDEKDW